MESYSDDIFSILGNERLLKLLVDIRKEITWPSNKENITKLGTTRFFELLIDNLSRRCKPITDICLSILGECTMHADCAEKAISRWGILPNLAEMLRRDTRDDTVNKATFQILGNMCFQNQEWTALILDPELQFVRYLVELLEISPEDYYSGETVLMALRFLKLIINRQTVSALVNPSRVLRVTRSLYTRLITSTRDETKDIILQKVFELFYELSRYSFVYCELVGANGDTVDLIMPLCRAMRVSPIMITKTIINFLIGDYGWHQEQFLVALNWIRGTLTETDRTDSRDIYMNYVQCLCVLMINIRGMPFQWEHTILLNTLDILGDSAYTDLECSIMIVFTLNQTHNYAHSKKIKVLLRKLNSVIDEGDETSNFEHPYNKRRIEKPHCCYPDWYNILRRRYRDDVQFVPEDVVILSSIVSENSSPLANKDDHPSMEKDRHSVETRLCTGNCQFMDRPFHEERIRKLKTLLVHEMVELIYVYHSLPSCKEVIYSEEMIITLSKCLVYLKYNHRGSLVEIISKLISAHSGHLMSTFIEKINGMMQYQHGFSCTECRENGYAGEDIIRAFIGRAGSKRNKEAGCKDVLRMFQEGCRVVKEQIVLLLPEMVRNIRLIEELYNICGGWDILVQLLESGSPHRNRTMRLLYRLTHLIPVFSDNLNEIKLKQRNPISTKVRLVALKLDDGASLQADCNLLTGASDYFSCLFGGHFVESGKDEVVLRKVQTNSLSLVLHLLEHPDDAERCVREYDLDIILDAVAITDMYLLYEIHSCLVIYVQKYRIRPATVVDIYRWSLESKLNMLRKAALKVALAKTEESTWLEIFNELLALGNISDLMKDMSSVIFEYISPPRKNHPSEIINTLFSMLLKQ